MKFKNVMMHVSTLALFQTATIVESKHVAYILLIIKNNFKRQTTDWIIM